MNRRLMFTVFILACIAGLWNLRGMLTPDAPEVPPYAARPELLNNAPAMVNTDNTAESTTDTLNVRPTRQTAQQRMEAAVVVEQIGLA